MSTQERTVETDLVSAFNAEETRPVNANQPLVSDPVLYINETSADWDDGNLSTAETPINMSFVVYNPKPYPYTVTEIGYNITMNGIAVGEGGTQREQVIPPGGTATIRPRTVIDNGRLDEWWVSHLQRNQVTDLRIDFALVIDPDTGGVTESVEPFRLPVTQLDYNETIETDIFGTKPADGTTATDGSESDTSDDSTATPGEDDSGPPTSTVSPTDTPTDDGGILDGGGDEPTPSGTPTDDGGILGTLDNLGERARVPA